MTGPARSPLKVAVMSFAHVHAYSYLSHLLRAPGVEVLASDPGGVAAEGELPRGADFAALLGAPYVDSYDELFAWAPDAVVICAENSGHLEAVERATAAGAHILCEKPLATTTADAREIVRLADAAGVSVMTAFPIRFTSAFAELRARVQGGAVGEPLAVLGTNNGKIPVGDRRWFTDPAFSGGGALVDHVVHCADLLDLLLSEPPAWVRAVGNGILHGDLGLEVETGGFVTVGYPSGVFATIDCSWSQPSNAAVWGDVTLQVTGTAGSLSMSAMGRSISGTTREGDVWLPFGLDFDGLMIDHFLDSVREGNQPQPDGHVGIRTTQIVDAARASARSGRTVRLDS
jgi:predicted dehydrogenase